MLGLLLAAGPALAQPSQLSELAFLPGDDASLPAPGRQLTPEIAPGSSGYLAVWVDQRTAFTAISTFSGGPNFDPYVGSMWDIYAARIDAGGNLIDEVPIIVVQPILNQGMPDVAWNGQNWVVVWRDIDQQAGVFTLDGARIAPDGTVLDPGGVSLRHDTYNSYPVDPDIAFAGDEFLLVWMQDSGEIAGQRSSRICRSWAASSASICTVPAKGTILAWPPAARTSW